MSKDKQTLGRLKKRSEFLFVRDGAYRAIGSVVVQMRKNPETSEHKGQIRAGFTATKKIGGAVRRNRVKRRLKHAVNLRLPLYGLPGHDYVFIARKSTHERPFEDLCNDIDTALTKLAQSKHPKS